MTQLKISSSLLESLIGLNAVDAYIVDCTFQDGIVYFTIESLYKDKPLPKGTVLIQVIKSIDTKLVLA